MSPGERSSSDRAGTTLMVTSETEIDDVNGSFNAGFEDDVSGLSSEKRGEQRQRVPARRAEGHVR